MERFGPNNGTERKDVVRGIRPVLWRVREEPWKIFSAAAGLLNGLWHRLKYLWNPRIRFGRWPRIRGRLVILGPGRVTIGDYAWIDSLSTGTTIIKTHRPTAEVTLGHWCGLNGTRLHCFERITIHDLSNIADAYIVDSPAHSLAADRRMIPEKYLPTAPVEIGPNVWISVNTVVLHGVVIGENSVVGACTLVRDSVPANVFVAGNPLRVIRSIPERTSSSEGVQGFKKSQRNKA
ncbi:MAG: acyltransferase [Candidatus Hydrogenedentota bacterium]|nr:MAG: acyltransferase [Candidatus Hydrogenedentota bacterium]